jgi:sulfite oxidase
MDSTMILRRKFLREASLLGIAALDQTGPLRKLLDTTLRQQNSAATPQSAEMIVYSTEYLTLEMPMSHLTTWITPVESFFVRNNLLQPQVDLSAWRLSVTGEVDRPITFTLSEFMQLVPASVTNTIECAGNGRVNFSPRISGVPWGRGGVGNANFEGPRLADVLRLTRPKPTARHVAFGGLDVAPGGASSFIRSIPIGKAMDPYTLLATKMNGAKLTPEHGFPVRALVPGWIGSTSIKWLREVRVLPQEYAGFYMDPGYRIPVSGGARADSSGQISKTVSLTSLCVKSIIAQPSDGAVLSLSARLPVPIRGACWAGESAIARVEVSSDGGETWSEAELASDHAKYAWRLWGYDWKPAAPGSYLIVSRATDSAGHTQPVKTEWNPGGYLWNGVDTIRVQIRD